MTTTFSPAPSDIHAILAALCDPAHSFNAVADSCGTTTHALSLWLASPEIAAQLERVEHSASQRVRLLALSLLPQAMMALHRVLKEYTSATDEELKPHADETARGRANTQHRSTRASVLAVARLLSSLSKLVPGSRSNSTKPNANSQLSAGQRAPSPTREVVTSSR